MASGAHGDSRDDAGPKRRVVYAFLRAVARLAERLPVPAKQVQEWARLAYFQELRHSGLTVAEACGRLGISAPTGARLSRVLKTDFLAREQDEHDLPKRIAFMLWAGPMSRARIAQVLTRDEPAAIDRALRVLLREKRIVEVSGRTSTFQITKPEDRLVRPGWAARLTALQSLLTNVVDVVHARFFEESSAAFARTVSFRTRAADRAELKRFYEETVWPFLEGLEDGARGADPDDVEMTRLSIVWVSDPERSASDD